MTEPLLLCEESDNTIDIQLARVFTIAGCRTQVELAEVLGIRQSSIADAKRRGRVPPGWLLTLLRLHGVNPDWITKGARPKFLITGPAREADDQIRDFSPGPDTDAPLVRKLLHCFSLHDLTGELARRRGATEEARGE